MGWKIALEIGAVKTDIERILIRKWLEEGDTEIDVTSVKYRADEYSALSGEVSTTPGASGDFLRESMNVAEYNLPHIKSISLIEKVRVVKALIGFSRIIPVISKTDEGFVHVKEPETRWYPAHEVRVKVYLSSWRKRILRIGFKAIQRLLNGQIASTITTPHHLSVKIILEQ